MVPWFASLGNVVCCLSAPRSAGALVFLISSFVNIFVVFSLAGPVTVTV